MDKSWKLCGCNGCDCQYVDIVWRTPEDNAKLNCKCYHIKHYQRGNEVHWIKDERKEMVK